MSFRVVLYLLAFLNHKYIVNQLKVIDIGIEKITQVIWMPNTLFFADFSPTYCHYIMTNNNILCMECINESIALGRSYSDSNVDISYCIFIRVSVLSGNGGVISINNADLSMNITQSTFYNCASFDNGGAINLEKSSNSTLKMVCANRCTAGYYHFAYLKTNEKNSADYLSIAKCSHSTTGYYPIYFSSLQQRLENSNSSMNCCQYYSGAGIRNSNNSYCTFSNNKVFSGGCIHFVANNGFMAFVNIVHNNSPSNGILYISGGSPKMHYCIFDENHDKLLYITSGSLEISHSFISHSGITSSLNNNSLIKKQTYQFQFFNSHLCFTDAPHPTINETPPITMEMTIEASIKKTASPTRPRTYDDSCTFHLDNRRGISIILQLSLTYPMIYHMFY